MKKIKLISLTLTIFSSVSLYSCQGTPKNHLHTIVIDEAVEATYEHDGLTEGCHCSTCGEVIVEQVTIPQLQKSIVNFIYDENKATLIGDAHQELKKDESSTPVTIKTKPGYQFEQWSNHETSREISVTTDHDLDVEAQIDDAYPVIRINVKDNAPIASKETWLNCNISTTNVDNRFELIDVEAQVKGRGNNTWDFEKKPYKFKFSTKQNLFGLGKAKKWNLLADYVDPSGIRNFEALRVAKVMDDIGEYTMDCQPVELFINNEYYGVYLLTEQIEIGNNRVDICNDTSLVDTGYLIEMDMGEAEEGVEGETFFKINGAVAPFNIKEPEAGKDLTSAQFNFIKNYFEAAAVALFSNDYSQVEQYFDMDTFMDSYIVQETFKSVDCRHLSFWLYKDAGGKICCGPVWDYDVAVGNCNYEPLCCDPEKLYANVNYFYLKMLDYPEAKKLLGEKLVKYKDKVFKTIENVKEYALENSDAYYRNYEKWPTIGVDMWPYTQEIKDLKTWEENMDYVTTFLTDSYNILVKYFPKSN